MGTPVSTKKDFSLFPKLAYGFTPELGLQYLGEERLKFVNKLIELYRQYDGKHWVKENGEEMTPEDLKAQYNLDYLPTMITVKLPSWFVDRRASFMFERPIALAGIAKQVDQAEQTARPDYQPSDRQKAENVKASAREQLCYKIMKQNHMNEKLLKAARDHFIGGSVCAKLHYVAGRGLRVIWRPRLEFWPVYDPDDADELQKITFVAFEEDEKTIWKQVYWMAPSKQKVVDDGGMESEVDGPMTCWIEEGRYDTALRLIEQVVPPTDLGLPFIPIEIFPNGGLTGETEGRSLLEDIYKINEEIEKKLSDASDSLRFKMFAITVFLNAAMPSKKDIEEGRAEPIQIAPNAVLTANSSDAETPADVKVLESKFEYRETLEAHIDRCIKFMHQLANVPQLSPELIKGLGQLSGFAILLLYGSIISATNQSIITWKPRLQRLFGKALYMLNKYETKGVYDDELVRTAALNEITLSDLDELVEVKTFMPIPTNEAEMVEIETKKIAAYLQSITGAMDQLGEENPERKLAEIIAERLKMREQLSGPEEQPLKPNNVPDDDNQEDILERMTEAMKTMGMPADMIQKMSKAMVGNFGNQDGGKGGSPGTE